MGLTGLNLPKRLAQPQKMVEGFLNKPSPEPLRSTAHSDSMQADSMTTKRHRPSAMIDEKEI